MPTSEAPTYASPRPVTTGFPSAGQPMGGQGIKRGVDGEPKPTTGAG